MLSPHSSKNSAGWPQHQGKPDTVKLAELDSQRPAHAVGHRVRHAAQARAQRHGSRLRAASPNSQR